MAFRSIEEFEQILRDTPPAARYLDLHWSIAGNYHEWREIRSRMAGAEMAVRQSNPEHADVYALLRDVAAMHAEHSIAVNGVLAMVKLEEAAA